jgi:hypothetical protein
MVSPSELIWRLMVSPSGLTWRLMVSPSKFFLGGLF